MRSSRLNIFYLSHKSSYTRSQAICFSYKTCCLCRSHVLFHLFLVVLLFSLRTIRILWILHVDNSNGSKIERSKDTILQSPHTEKGTNSICLPYHMDVNFLWFFNHVCLNFFKNKFVKRGDDSKVKFVWLHAPNFALLLWLYILFCFWTVSVTQYKLLPTHWGRYSCRKEFGNFALPTNYFHGCQFLKKIQ